MDYSNVTTLLDFNWYDIDAFQNKECRQIGIEANWLRLILAILVCLAGNFGRYRGAGFPRKSSSSTDWRSERIALEDEFLANDLKQDRSMVRCQRRSPNSLRPLCPCSPIATLVVSIFSSLQKNRCQFSRREDSQEWLDQINQASVDHGSRIFDLAKHAGG